jgi:hypothetical protein
MANFVNAPARVGATEVVVYTAPSKSILIGCNLANLTGGVLPCSLILRKTGGDFHVVKNKRVDNGANEEVMRGNKLTLAQGDRLVAVSVVGDAFDVILSLLEGVT